jgi:hypothetical protein
MLLCVQYRTMSCFPDQPGSVISRINGVATGPPLLPVAALSLISRTKPLAESMPHYPANANLQG